MSGAGFVSLLLARLSDASYNALKRLGFYTSSFSPKSSSSQETLLGSTGDRVERPMGDTEVSYFLPSRESGVNDM